VTLEFLTDDEAQKVYTNMKKEIDYDRKLNGTLGVVLIIALLLMICSGPFIIWDVCRKMDMAYGMFAVGAYLAGLVFVVFKVLS